MAIVPIPPHRPMDDDPDDHRPASSWSLVVDTADEGARVESMTVLFEEMAVGDRIPLHIHEVDEVIVIDAGIGEARLGDELAEVRPGQVVFVPAGTPHGTRNTGDGPLRLHAVFPTTRIDMRYLERNPAPGTEGRAPGRFVYDVRSGEVTEVPT